MQAQEAGEMCRDLDPKVEKEEDPTRHPKVEKLFEPRSVNACINEEIVMEKVFVGMAVKAEDEASMAPQESELEKIARSRVGHPSDSVQMTSSSELKAPSRKRVEKRPREEDDDESGGEEHAATSTQGKKKKRRRGKARCRPGANERRWKQLEAAQCDSR